VRPTYGGSAAAADGFVEAMAASPLGVTLLAVLESRTRRPGGFALSLETSPASVASAVEMVEVTQSRDGGCRCDQRRRCTRSTALRTGLGW
jgi:hypothetical protein